MSISTPTRVGGKSHTISLNSRFACLRPDLVVFGFASAASVNAEILFLELAFIDSTKMGVKRARDIDTYCNLLQRGLDPSCRSVVYGNVFDG